MTVEVYEIEKRLVYGLCRPVSEDPHRREILDEVASQLRRQQPGNTLWPQCNALQACKYRQVEVSEPTYRTHRINLKWSNGDSNPCMSAESFHPKTARCIHTVYDVGVTLQSSLLSLMPGQAVVFYGHRVVGVRGGARQDLYVFVGLVPWFKSAEVASTLASQTTEFIGWKHLLINSVLEPHQKLPDADADVVARLQHPLAFLAVPRAAASVTMRESISREDRHVALMSFLLRWHKASNGLAPDMWHAYHQKLPQMVIEASRDEERALMLYTRSCVHFQRAAPRNELFAREDSLPLLIAVLRSLRQDGVAQFVVAQTCSILQFVLRTEIVRRGQMAIISFSHQFLLPLAAMVERSHFAAQNRIAGNINSELAAANAPESTVAYQTGLMQDDTEARTPFNLRVRCGAEIDDAELPRDDLLFLTARDSHRSLASVLSSCSAGDPGTPNDGENPRDDNPEAAQRVLVEVQESCEAKLSNSVVASFTLDSDVAPLTEAFLRPGMMRDSALCRGTVYVRFDSIVEGITAMFRAFLVRYVNTSSTGAATAPAMVGGQSRESLESRFARSMPVCENLYRTDDRDSAFNDVALKGYVFEKFVINTAGEATVTDFINERNGVARLPIPSPEMFDEARYYNLARTDVQLAAKRRLPYTLYSFRHGAIPIPPETLNGALHLDTCTHGPLNRDEREKKLSRAVSNSSRSTLADIEDLVNNAHVNRAMPLCMSSLMAGYGRTANAYPKNDDRFWLAATLNSFKAPDLDTTATTRYLLRHSPTSKYANQYSDVSKWDDEKFAESHAKNAKLRNKLMLDKQTPESEERSKIATTCSSSCSTMAYYGSHDVFRCPFRVGFDRGRLDAQLHESGVESAEVRRAILDTKEVRQQCKMQLEHSRPLATRYEPVFTALTADVEISHPLHYFHLASDHLARYRQRRRPIVVATSDG